MEQQTVSKEACKLSLKAALAQQEFHSYIKNANHSIENLTDNGELETCDKKTSPYNINIAWEPS